MHSCCHFLSSMQRFQQVNPPVPPAEGAKSRASESRTTCGFLTKFVCFRLRSLAAHTALLIAPSIGGIGGLHITYPLIQVPSPGEGIRDGGYFPYLTYYRLPDLDPGPGLPPGPAPADSGWTRFYDTTLPGAAIPDEYRTGSTGLDPVPGSDPPHKGW